MLAIQCFYYLEISLHQSIFTVIPISKIIFAILFIVQNKISLLCHEQESLRYTKVTRRRLRFERYFFVMTLAKVTMAISQNVALLNLLVHDLANLSQYQYLFWFIGFFCCFCPYPKRYLQSRWINYLLFIFLSVRSFVRMLSQFLHYCYFIIVSTLFFSAFAKSFMYS